jgi:hypothetical protein
LASHSVRCATDFFRNYGAGSNTLSVIFGHKNQGKTQFLYFLAQLLIGLGEGVIFLIYIDKSAA